MLELRVERVINELAMMKSLYGADEREAELAADLALLKCELQNHTILQKQ